MGSRSSENWWLYALPCATSQAWDCVSGSVPSWQRTSSWMLLGFVAAMSFCVMILRWSSPGGCAWGALNYSCDIPGPRGWPVLGILLEMKSLAHRRLAQLAKQHSPALTAFSLGSTRVIITSSPDVARELLNSSAFADRPLKQSAQELLFARAIGFAPFGDYWRSLRRIAANHLFSPRSIAENQLRRQMETAHMLGAIYHHSLVGDGSVTVRTFLQHASLNNIMSSVFGRRMAMDQSSGEECELQSVVREGFDLLGSFNWADHLPALKLLDPQGVLQRCRKLLPRVKRFVQNIIDDHRRHAKSNSPSTRQDFVDALLSLQEEEKLSDEDIISVLWEMIFRGTDTVAILTEWVLAELVIHPAVQERLHRELDEVVGSSRHVTDSDVSRMSYLQAVVKETLRLHPPGPLLSWARLARHDAYIAGHHIPTGTSAMVNMWAITHDESVWPDASSFKPERFMISDGGVEIDIRGNDLRLAPFGAGRRVCPGRALGLATVHLWLARLFHHFQWLPDPFHPVDLSEVLKLSCEMESPLSARPLKRLSLAF
ncbi:hypothetical protein O6H91_20G072500 [Diphasiastrum complanatum]|uniref:Uncharacterized protein n=1 Tax=Diphasiastrum complanatum TaxID=34168 RepID=A0ACC2ARR3_DIPCM|nr:hypothetical protein O6H91_20G072500 [Diphasiastrum complanatum]